MKQSKFLLVLLTVIFFSCQTNKAPIWMEEPPLDDDVHLYIISTEDLSWDDVTTQLFKKYALETSDYTFKRVKALLENQEFNTIIDTWDSGEVVYQLHRLDREFFEPIMEFYITQYSNMESLYFDREDLIQSQIETLNYYDAIQSYIDFINELFDEESEKNALAILRLMEGLLSLYDGFHLDTVESFSELVRGESVGDNRLGYRYTGDINYNGLTYIITFSEGWNLRKRSIKLSLKDSSFSFTPVIPEVRGIYKIEGELSLTKIEELITRGLTFDYLAPYMQEFTNRLNQIRLESSVSLEYTVLSNFHSSTKVISFGNEFIHEGVQRFLLEEEYEVLISPRPKTDETLINYIRDVNRITSNSVRYLILGREINTEDIVLDEGSLYKIDAVIDVIDLRSSQVIQTKKLQTDFLSAEESSDLAYLDFGLKLGELIYNLEF